MTATTIAPTADFATLQATAAKHGLTAYLAGRKGKEFTTRKPTRGTTNNAKIACLLEDTQIPEGTTGLLFQHDTYAYSEYRWIGDEQYPAPGAKRTLASRAYTFICFLPDGRFASAYASVSA